MNVLKRLNSSPVSVKAKSILQQAQQPAPADSLHLLTLLAWAISSLKLDVTFQEKVQTVYDRANEKLQQGQAQQAYDLLTGLHDGEAQISVSSLSARTPAAAAEKMAQEVVSLAVL